MRLLGALVGTAGWLLSACHHPSAVALAPAPAQLAGCYAVMQVTPTGGDSMEVMFPYFFGLDTVTIFPRSGPAHRVLLPSDDFTSWAGGWLWRPTVGGAEISIEVDSSGYRLTLTPGDSGWSGHLVAWNGAERTGATLSGPRVACPRGLLSGSN